MRPFFSIIVPAYNSSSTIRVALDSILHQSFEDYEIIVVDDGSTDDTRGMISNFYTNKVRYVYQENLGVGAARNHGADVALGKYLIFLDSDDWFGVDAFESFHLAIDSERVALVLGVISYFDKRKNKIRDILPSSKGIHISHGLPGSFVLSRSVFKELGGYDVMLSYSENSDLFLRAYLARVISPEATRVNLKGGVCKYLEPGRERSIRYARKKYESAKYFLDKHKAFFETAPKYFINFKRIEAFGAFQNNEFDEARRVTKEVIAKYPFSLKSYLHYVLFCFPSLAKVYYDFRL